jgi:hypothetical protein
MWSSPAVLLALLLVYGLGGQRSAAAGELWFAADTACAAGDAAVELADLLANDDPPAAAAAAPGYGKGCSKNAQCKKKSYCAKGVGDCKGKGECKAKPELCPEIFQPVCGCDDKTYSNSCVAAASGVNVKADGQCEKAVKCKTNAQCGQLEFCAKPDGKCDDEGVCAKRPINAFCGPTDPVCGCDDKTYPSRCRAHQVGVDVKHAGKCEK